MSTFTIRKYYCPLTVRYIIFLAMTLDSVYNGLKYLIKYSGKAFNTSWKESGDDSCLHRIEFNIFSKQIITP